MKRTILYAIAFTVLCGAVRSLADAPAPYPIRINSRVTTAPPVATFAATARSFRATFTDGATASDVSDYTPFMSWSTSSVAVAVSTSSWAFVASGTNGVVDFTFTPAAVNYAPGTYGYEIGVRDASTGEPRTYAQGRFTILASPTGTGADPVTWTTNINAEIYTVTGQWPASSMPSHDHDYTSITNPPWLTEYTETDLIALAALASSGTVWRTDWETYADDAVDASPTPTLAEVADAGPFAGTEQIEVQSVTASNVVLRTVSVVVSNTVIRFTGITSPSGANQDYSYVHSSGGLDNEFFGGDFYRGTLFVISTGTDGSYWDLADDPYAENYFRKPHGTTIDSLLGTWENVSGEGTAEATLVAGLTTNTVTFVIDPVTGALKLDADLDVDGNISADNLGTMSAEAAADYYTATQTGTAIAGATNALAAVAHTGSYTDLSDTPAAQGLFAGAGTTGLVTSVVGDAGNFLRADGVWIAIPGGGDMLVLDYDPAGGARQVAFSNDLAAVDGRVATIESAGYITAPATTNLLRAASVTPTPVTNDVIYLSSGAWQSLDSGGAGVTNSLSIDPGLAASIDFIRLDVRWDGVSTIEWPTTNLVTYIDDFILSSNVTSVVVFDSALWQTNWTGHLFPKEAE